MKKIFLLSVALILIITGLIFFISNSNTVSTDPEDHRTLEMFYRQNAHLLDPYDFWMLNDDLALVSDPANNEFPVYILDLVSGNIVANIRAGNGPSEVHPTFYKRVSRFSNGDIFLWTWGQNRANIFYDRLQYLRMLDGEPVRQTLYQVSLLNDSTVCIVDVHPDSFLKLFRLHEGYDVKDEKSLLSISIHDHDFLFPLRNHIQKQTIRIDSDGESLYMGFEYSSLLLRINEYGIQWYTFIPFELPVPDVYEEEGIYALPDISRHPLGILDIAVDDRFLYVILSNEKLSRVRFLRHIANPDKLIDEMKHRDIVHRYDKENGSYLDSFQLPVSAKRIDVTDDALYLLHSYDTLPAIIKVEKPDWMK